MSDADSSLAPPAEADLDSVRRLGEAYQRIHTEVGKVIVGQQQVIEEILIAMFAGGRPPVDGCRIPPNRQFRRGAGRGKPVVG